MNYIIVVALAVMLAGCKKKSLLPDLRETYSYKDTRPFGGFAAFRILQNSYPGHTVSLQSQPFERTAAWSVDNDALNVSISRRFFSDEPDIDALMGYVYRGNTVFIAAAAIDSLLLDQANCKLAEPAWMSDAGPALYTNTGVKLVADITDSNQTKRNYYYLPFRNYFSVINDPNSRIVGYNEKGQPNCIVVFRGKGRLFLHCDPRAFSNYFLLRNNNHRYLAELLQIMPENPGHIYWNNYYLNKSTQAGKKSFSGLSTLFKHPPLKWAFLVALSLLLLYILFNGKRRQRIVPVIKPVQNSSVAFAEAIAGLYLKEKDNKTIADKMITYFNEHIRSRYFLNTGMPNQDFLLSLSRKSAVPLEQTIALYNTMKEFSSRDEIDDEQLLKLNEQIQQFYKNRN